MKSSCFGPLLTLTLGLTGEIAACTTGSGSRLRRGARLLLSLDLIPPKPAAFWGLGCFFARVPLRAGGGRLRGFTNPDPNAGTSLSVRSGVDVLEIASRRRRVGVPGTSCFIFRGESA